MANRARSVLTPPAMQASTPSLPRAQGPGPAPQVPVIDTGRGMENLAAGIEQAALTVQSDQSNRDALKRLQFEQQFQTDAAQRAAGLDPMTVDYDKLVVQAYTEAGDAIVEAAGDQFHSTLPLERLRTNVAEATGQANRAAIVARRGAVAAVAEAQYGADALQTLASIRKDPDNADVYLAQFADKAREIIPSLPGVKAAALALSFGQDAVINQVEGLALAGRYDEARALAKANSGALGTATNRSLPNLVTEIEGQHERDYLAVTEGLRQQHRVAIAEATTLSQLEDTGRRIDAQAAAGLYNGREEFLGSLKVSMASRRAVIIENERELNVALAHYTTGTGLDSQKEADLVWASTNARRPANMPLDQRLKTVALFAQETGWVPTQFKRLVENAERVTNPTILASAAQIYDAVRQSGASPAVNTGVDKEHSRVVLTSALAAATGMGYDDAAQYVSDNLPDTATLAARREKFKTDFKDFSPIKYIQDNARGADGGVFGFARAVSPQVAAEFEKSLRLFYDMSGDKAVAERAAMQRFNATHGLTGTASGQERVGRLPAEWFFPGAANSLLDAKQKRAIIDGDVRRALTLFGIKPAIVIGDKEDLSGIPDFDLVPDAQTEAEVARGARPSYEVRVRNSVGALVPVPVDTTGGTRIKLRYVMPDVGRLTANPEYAAIVDIERRRVQDGPFYMLPQALRPKAPDLSVNPGPTYGERYTNEGGEVFTGAPRRPDLSVPKTQPYDERYPNEAKLPPIGRPQYDLNRRGPILGTRGEAKVEK